MRKSTTLASSVLCRSFAATHSAAAAAVPHRILQASLYSSGSAGSSYSSRRWFSPLLDSLRANSAASLGLAGGLCAAAVAASLSQEVHAKEPPAPEVIPKEVILYQYEACPFCNKVKGIISSLIIGDLFIFRRILVLKSDRS